MATNEQPRVRPNNTGRGKSGKRVLSPRERPHVTWSEVNNQLLRDTIVAVTDGGAAIMLGVTSEQGAYSITVLNGDDKVREWPHTVDELEATLRWLCSMFAVD